MEKYNPIQVNETIEKANDGTIIKRSLMINIRSETPEKAVDLYQKLKKDLNGGSAEEQTRLTGLDGPDVPTCECGAKMTLRQNGKKHSLFWGCSTYPKCKITMEYKKAESKEEIPF